MRKTVEYPVRLSVSFSQLCNNKMNSNNGSHILKVRVRYAETDKMGLAYNGHYLTWFEVARTELLRDNGLTYNKLEESGYRLPLIEANVKYLKPALYDDVLTIRTYIGRKPGIRIRLSYEIWNGESKLATGFTEHVFTDENLKPRKPPKKFLKKMSEMWKKNSTTMKKEVLNYD